MRISLLIEGDPKRLENLPEEAVWKGKVIPPDTAARYDGRIESDEFHVQNE